ncbi:hypothetical protein V9W64_09225 [Neisseria leonii]|uniref:Uncharacterized protein n=1 Tax=Neisseria leonii TaxID=2995413 RepID=A0A9X4E1C4_9NEIS|nr:MULTISPECIES: hypothetical protein [unclassified Neisseria]MDD9324726.1 hypothetical protein [Neisseria sp. 3986]MDD9327711.1 hypothetical protein [Neisseria sp. 51.81]
MMYAADMLQRYSHDGLVYRAFDHAVIAAAGMVVAVPLVQTAGVLKHLVDQSPVPWQELWAVLDAEPETQAMFDRDLSIPPIIHRLGLADTVLDVAKLPEYRATVFIHPETGLRLGISSDYIHKTNKANR